MFAAYHATKAAFVSESESHAAIQSHMDKFWVPVAQSLVAEAVERALSRTLFDRAEFIQFFGLPIR